MDPSDLYDWSYSVALASAQLTFFALPVVASTFAYLWAFEYQQLERPMYAIYEEQAGDSLLMQAAQMSVFGTIAFYVPAFFTQFLSLFGVMVE